MVHYGSHAEGPRGHAHGGATAAVLDVACGSLCWWLGEIVVTGSLEVKYRRLIPLGTSLVLNARVTETQGKKLLVSAELCDAPDEEGFGGGAGRLKLERQRPLCRGEMHLHPNRQERGRLGGWRVVGGGSEEGIEI